MFQFYLNGNSGLNVLIPDQNIKMLTYIQAVKGGLGELPYIWGAALHILNLLYNKHTQHLLMKHAALIERLNCDNPQPTPKPSKPL